MKNIDSHNHVQGKSIYLDDIQELKGTLYALPFDATVYTQAIHRTGIVRIITAKDIPG